VLRSTAKVRRSRLLMPTKSASVSKADANSASV
jgi:hypothetical protein